MVLTMAFASVAKDAGLPFFTSSAKVPDSLETIAEISATLIEGWCTATSRANLYDVDPIESVTPIQIISVSSNKDEPLGNMRLSAKSHSRSKYGKNRIR